MQLTIEGVDYDYEIEKIPYTISSSYLPDFRINRDMGPLYIECKGHFRRDDQRKLATVKKQYPGLDLRIVFYRIPKISIQKWCDKHNIPWAVQEIPKSWLTMVKHPQNRYERMKINEKKNEKRKLVRRKREGLDPSVSVSDENAEAE